MKNVLKKSLVLMLVISMALSVFPAFAEVENGSHPFSDVSSAEWYNEYVQTVWEKGLVEGTSETTFEPAGTLTKGMILTILGRHAGVDEKAYAESKFDDVDAKEWYAPYVAWAVENKIAEAVSETEFAPNAIVTREEIAVIIHNYINAEGCAAAENGTLSYTDVDAISEEAKVAVIACKNAGIMEGNPDKTFLPKNNLSRAEFAAVVTRVDKYIASLKNDPDTYMTFNEADHKKFIDATKNLKYTDFEPFTLAKWLYWNAYTKAWTMTGPAETVIDAIFIAEDAPVTTNTVNYIKMIAPGLYSEKAVTSKIKEHFYGEAKEITKEDLIIGDFIFVQKDEKAKIYAYVGDKFVEMKKDYAPDVAIDEVLSNLAENDIYFVLRPSIVMTTFNHNDPVEELDLTPAQAAVIGTAETYLLRGDRVQYDDGHISPYSEYRWQHSVKAPEEATSDYTSYTNCAAFTHDVYLYALDYEIDGMWATRLLIEAEESIRPFYYEPTGKETEEEKAEITAKFFDTLQPADIIVTRRGSSGHAMLYVGNGNIIHSSGSTYSYDNNKETYEPSIRQKLAIDLFTKAETYPIFGGKVTQLAIVRPLNKWNGEVPENTVSRITTMKGIMAEKLSSHKANMSVNPGEEVEYSFFMYNSNDYDVTLEIKDVAPEHTTYVSGADKVDGENLSWTVTIPAGKDATVSYKVKVNEDAALDTKIYGDKATIGGVKFVCPAIYVKNTLTKDEQAKLTQSANKLMASEMTAFDKANAIYKDAGLSDKILPGEGFMDIADGIFYDKPFDGDRTRYYPHGCFDLKREGIYSEMVVNSLYGGRGAWTTPVGERTRLLREKYLMTGDIVLWRTADKEYLYMYTNDGLLHLNTGEYIEDAKTCLEKMLGQYPDTYDIYFVVIRPSHTLK